MDDDDGVCAFRCHVLNKSVAKIVMEAITVPALCCDGVDKYETSVGSRVDGRVERLEVPVDPGIVFDSSMLDGTERLRR